MERRDYRILAPTQSTHWQRLLGRDLDRGCEYVNRVAHRHSGGCCGTLDGDPAWRRTDLQCWSFGPFDPSVECSRTIALRVYSRHQCTPSLADFLVASHWAEAVVDEQPTLIGPVDHPSVVELLNKPERAIAADRPPSRRRTPTAKTNR